MREVWETLGPTWAVVSYFASFGLGFLVGVFTKFLADWLTDKRREYEIKKASKAALEKLEKLIPELIAEMRKDVRDNPQCRDFILLESEGSYFGQVRLRYYVSTHKTLLEQVTALETKGFVECIWDGETPVYRMSERFVELLSPP